MKKLTLIFLLIIFSKFIFAQWQQIIIDSPVNSIQTILTAGDTIFAAGVSLFKSVDNGNTWDSINNGLPHYQVTMLVKNGNILFAGTHDTGIFRSTNNGQFWVPVDSGLPNIHITGLAISGNNIFAGTQGGVFISTDNGQHWNPVNNGLTSTDILSLTVFGNHIIAGTLTYTFISINNGQLWVPTNMPNANYPSIFAKRDNYIFSATYSGLYLSTDSGFIWTAINNIIASKHFTALTVYGSAIFAGTQCCGEGVYVSIDNGNNWTLTGLSEQNIWALSANDNYIFAGAEPTELWRRPLSQFVGLIDMHDNSKIKVHPNPANDNVIIETPQLGTIEIKNIQGKQIKSIPTSVNNTNIDVLEFPSGLYIVKVKTEKGVAWEKFVKE